MLIRKIEEVRELLPVSTAVDLDRLKPHLELAEENFIKPLLGTLLFKDLNDIIGELVPPALAEHEDAFRELLMLVRRSQIHLAYWMGYEVLNAYISDGGFRRQESNTVKSLYKYQEDNLKDYFKSSGYNGLDAVLEFIERNITHFENFKQSETWKFIKGAFIPDTSTLNSIYFIGNSRLIFMRIQPYMKVVEDLSISQIIDNKNFEFIKTEMATDDPDERVISILPYIRKPIAFLAVSMLMEDSGADLTDKGLFFEGKAQTMMSDSVKSPAEIERVQNLVKRNKNLGKSYLIQLKQFLIENSELWGGYSAPRHGIHNRNNTGKKTFWA
jgi:hypothetical protein